ncbi:MAG: Hydrolase, alpha/beta fold family functionally coupled to Phosphoribulokinase, partial [Labilithrix sp.]|nr:Hydrolase, alpha/beta fold family functionally coupled to Phosphoribulokinase [Labilithrix sp.]
MEHAQPTLETRARSFVAELSRGQWAHPNTRFDDAMTGAASPPKLQEIWSALEKDSGRFREVGGTSVREERGFRIVLVTCRFEKDVKTLRVVFDKDERVAGLFLDPPVVPWSPPAYAKVAAFEEREVEVGTAPALPGTLTFPRASAPVPAVVLVHGSGPSDRDESIGGAKPFKDLAWGLASQGVAVLRYVKRSRHAPAGIVTQRDEAERPARDAIELLAKTPGIDPQRIFLLGHSQGGYLAPRIAEANPSLAGLVILAGSTRPLQDLLIEQLTYFTTLDPNNAGLREKVEAARVFKQRVEAPDLGADEAVVFPVGGRQMTGAYFLDVRGYDPPQVAKKLACRLFILQGERD